MPLPPCRPLLPAVLPTRSRRSPVADISRAHSPCGLRLNLGWAVDLLAAIPGPHRRRIASRAAESPSGSALRAVTQPDANQPGHTDFTGVCTHGDRQSVRQTLLTVPRLLILGSISKEELGRSTWTLLHTLAAQWPSRPSRQQQKDLDMLVCRRSDG